MTPEERRIALVTYKLTGLFTPGMVVMHGWPFPIENVTIVTDAGEHEVVYSRPNVMGVWVCHRDQLRPIEAP